MAFDIREYVNRNTEKKSNGFDVRDYVKSRAAGGEQKKAQQETPAQQTPVIGTRDPRNWYMGNGTNSAGGTTGIGPMPAGTGTETVPKKSWPPRTANTPAQEQETALTPREQEEWADIMAMYGVDVRGNAGTTPAPTPAPTQTMTPGTPTPSARTSAAPITTPAPTAAPRTTPSPIAKASPDPMTTPGTTAAPKTTPAPTATAAPDRPAPTAALTDRGTKGSAQAQGPQMPQVPDEVDEEYRDALYRALGIEAPKGTAPAEKEAPAFGPELPERKTGSGADAFHQAEAEGKMNDGSEQESWNPWQDAARSRQRRLTDGLLLSMYDETVAPAYDTYYSDADKAEDIMNALEPRLPWQQATGRAQAIEDSKALLAKYGISVNYDQDPDALVYDLQGALYQIASHRTEQQQAAKQALGKWAEEHNQITDETRDEIHRKYWAEQDTARDLLLTKNRNMRSKEWRDRVRSLAESVGYTEEIGPIDWMDTGTINSQLDELLEYALNARTETRKEMDEADNPLTWDEIHEYSRASKRVAEREAAAEERLQNWQDEVQAVSDEVRAKADYGQLSTYQGPKNETQGTGTNFGFAASYVPGDAMLGAGAFGSVQINPLAGIADIGEIEYVYANDPQLRAQIRGNEFARTGDLVDPYAVRGYGSLNEDELATFNYMWNSPEYGPEKAKEFVEHTLGHYLMARYSAEYSEWLTDISVGNEEKGIEGDPWAASLMSLLLNTVSAYEAPGAVIAAMFGSDVDDEFTVRLLTQDALARDTIRSAVSASLADIANGLLSFAYGSGMSMLDNLSALMQSGGIGGSGSKFQSAMVQLMMSGAAASGTLSQLVNRDDIDLKTQGALALCDGIAEWITEKWSIEAFFKDPTNTLKYLMQLGVAEGSEEIASNWASRMMYWGLLGSDFDLAQRREELVAKGYTDKQACAIICGELLGEDIEAAAAGALSGVGMGAPRAAVVSLERWQQGRTQDRVAKLYEEKTGAEAARINEALPEEARAELGSGGSNDMATVRVAAEKYLKGLNEELNSGMTPEGRTRRNAETIKQKLQAGAIDEATAQELALQAAIGAEIDVDVSQAETAEEMLDMIITAARVAEETSEAGQRRREVRDLLIEADRADVQAQIDAAAEGANRRRRGPHLRPDAETAPEEKKKGHLRSIELPGQENAQAETEAETEDRPKRENPISRWWHRSHMVVGPQYVSDTDTLISRPTEDSDDALEMTDRYTGKPTTLRDLTIDRQGILRARRDGRTELETFHNIVDSDEDLQNLKDYIAERMDLTDAEREQIMKAVTQGKFEIAVRDMMRARAGLSPIFGDKAAAQEAEAEQAAPETETEQAAPEASEAAPEAEAEQAAPAEEQQTEQTGKSRAAQGMAGSTITNRQTGGQVSVDSISVADGDVVLTVTDENGETQQISRADADIEDEALDNLITVAAEYGPAANAVLQGYYASGEDVGNYIAGLRLADLYGRSTMTMDQAVARGAQVGLPETTVRTGYLAGKASRQAQEAANARITARQHERAMGGLTAETRSNLEDVIKSDPGISKARAQSLTAADAMMRAVGVNVEWFASETNEDGIRTAENGSYNADTNTIRMDVYAGSDTEDTSRVQIYSTMMHELTHAARAWAGKDTWVSYKRFVLDHSRKTDAAFEMEVENRAAGYMAKNNLSREDAIDRAEEEIVADASAKVEIDEGTLRELARKDMRLFDQIVDKIAEMFDRIVELFSKMREDGRLNRDAQRMLDVAEQQRDMWNKMVLEARENMMEEKKNHPRGLDSDQTSMTYAQADALHNTAEAYQEELGVTPEAAKIMEDGGYEKPDGGLYSVRTMDAWEKAIYKMADKDMLDEEGNVKAIELVKRIGDMVLNDAYMRQYQRSGMPSKGSPIRKNTEYTYTFDMDTLCPRTYQFRAYKDAIESKIGRRLTEAEARSLIEHMRYASLDIPCTYCYVESKRMALHDAYGKYMQLFEAAHNGGAEAAYRYLGKSVYDPETGFKMTTNAKTGVRDLTEAAKKWRDRLDAWAAEGATKWNPETLYQAYRSAERLVYEQLDEKYAKDPKNWKEDTKSARDIDGQRYVYRDFKLPKGVTAKKIAQQICRENGISWVESGKSGAQTQIETMVAQWLNDVQAGREHGLDMKVDTAKYGIDIEALNLHHEAMKYAASSSQAHGVENYAPYKDQILKTDPSLKGDINARGGFRIHSNNDYMEENLFDYLQFITHLAMDKRGGVGWMAHAYTKNSSFARLNRNTNIRVNMSIAMKGDFASGIRENAEEGMGWSLAREERNGDGKDFKGNDNAGIMAMTTNDDQLTMALCADWIDMIIPFHASGMPVELYNDVMAWQDYTAVQNDAALSNEGIKDALKVGLSEEEQKKIDKMSAADAREAYRERYGLQETHWKRANSDPKKIGEVREKWREDHADDGVPEPKWVVNKTGIWYEADNAQNVKLLPGDQYRGGITAEDVTSEEMRQKYIAEGKVIEGFAVGLDLKGKSMDEQNKLLADSYKALCRKYGLKPRFSGTQVRTVIGTDANGNPIYSADTIDITEHPGYAKVLKETARMDSVQQEVQAKFDEEWIKQELSSLSKKNAPRGIKNDHASQMVVDSFLENILGKDRPMGWDTLENIAPYFELRGNQDMGNRIMMWDEAGIEGMDPQQVRDMWMRSINKEDEAKYLEDHKDELLKGQDSGMRQSQRVPYRLSDTEVLTQADRIKGENQQENEVLERYRQEQQNVRQLRGEMDSVGDQLDSAIASGKGEAYQKLLDEKKRLQKKIGRKGAKLSEADAARYQSALDEIEMYKRKIDQNKTAITAAQDAGNTGEVRQLERQNEALTRSIAFAQQTVDAYGGETSEKTQARLDRVNAQIAQMQTDQDVKAIDKLRTDVRNLRRAIAGANDRMRAMQQSTALKGVIDRERQRILTNLGVGYGSEAEEYARNINNALERERYRQQAVSVAKQLIRAINTGDKKYRVPAQLAGPLGEFLQKLDLTESTGERKSLADRDLINSMRRLGNTLLEIEHSAKTDAEVGEGITDLASWLQLPEGYAYQWNRIVQEMEEASNRSGGVLRNMSLEDMRSVAETLTIMWSCVANANKFLAENRYRNATNAAQESIGEWLSLKERTSTNRAMDSIRGFLQWHNVTPYYAFKRMGKAAMAMFNELQDGWDKFNARTDEIIAFRATAYTDEEVRQWEHEVQDIRLESGKELTMTTAQLMSLYCLSRRGTEALNHLLTGGMRIDTYKIGHRSVQQTENIHLTRGDIRNMTSRLTDRQVEVASTLQAFLSNECAKWGNRVTMSMYGIKFFTEKSYFPMKTVDEGRAISTRENAPSLYKLMKQSFMNRLQPKANNALVIQDVFDVFTDHAANMAKMESLGLPMSDLLKWLNYSETNFDYDHDQQQAKRYDVSLRVAMKQAYGNDAIDYVRTMIEDLNGTSEAGRDYGLGGALMSRYKVASIAGNLRVVVQQVTSYWRAGAMISNKYLIKALGTRLKGQSQRAIENVGIAGWKSKGYYDTGIQRSLRSLIKSEGTRLDRVNEKLMGLAGKADDLTWGRIYTAVELETEDRYRAQGIEIDKDDPNWKKTVNDRMREIVYGTQVVDSTLTRSQIMRAKGIWNKSITAFMAEPLLTYSMVASEITGIMDDVRRGLPASEIAKRHKAQLVRTGVAVLMSKISVVLAQSLADAFRDDDDYETFLEKFRAAMTDNGLSEINPVTMLPVVKDIWNQLTGKDSSNLTGAVISDIYDTVKMYTTLLSSDSKSGRTAWGVVYQTIRTMDRIVGTGSANLLRDASAVWNTATRAIGLDLQLQTYRDKDSKGLDATYAAIMSGDEKRIMQLEKELRSNGVDVEKEEEGLATRILTSYKADEIDEATAKSWMQQYGGYGNENAETQKKLDERMSTARYERETGGKWAKRKDDYLEGKISQADAINYLVQYGGKTKDDAYWMVAGWEGRGKYDRLDEALISGRGVEDALKELRQHGVKEETVKSSITRGIHDAYDDGTMTGAHAVDMLVKHGGKTREQAEKTVKGWRK